MTARSCWSEISDREEPSWYLDPLVAEQKRTVHLGVCRRWSPGGAKLALKTDLFEEAFGEDALLPDLYGTSETWLAMDLAELTVRKARLREPRPAARFLVADARRLPLRSASLDFVLSTSTLDHFDSRREFVAAIAEVARVLRPGGRLILTIDNPSNPLYWPLRWLGRTRWVPFPFGYSPSQSRLHELLAAAGLEVVACETLIHNPRIVSTVLFIALRRLLRDRADRAIRGFLAAFEGLERLPTRGFTACFLATCAVRSTMPRHDPAAPDVISA